ncbi:MAG: PilW family protein [Rhodoferax sp.]
MTAPSVFSATRQHGGFSLVELLIALALGLAVLVALSAVYLTVKQSFRFQETSGRLQEDASFALDTIAKDLRMAGFAGCPGINKVTVSGVSTYYPGSVLDSGSPGGINGPNPLAQVETSNPEVIQQPLTALNFIRGFDEVPSSMLEAGAAPASSNTSSLFFAGGSVNSVAVSAAMATASASLSTDGYPYGWRKAKPPPNSGVYDLIVSDCTSSSLFKGKVTQSGGVTSIDHSKEMGNASAAFTSNQLFDTSAQVMPLEWNFYYVATRPGASTPSLYRVFYDGNTRQQAQELVSNVESMRLHYGENTGFDELGAPTLVADEWRTSASTGVKKVTDWSRVVAVRVGLMMVSGDDYANPDVDVPTPTLLGQDYTLPGGASKKRLRKEYSTTVVLRNSVAAR